MLKSNTVFLVEDDEDDSFIASTALSETFLDIETICFKSGESLLEKLKLIEPNQYPKLIILDINMPGIGGFETLRLINENSDWKAIPIIIMTTSSNKSDMVIADELGADMFIVKPSKYRETVQVLLQLRHYLDSKGKYTPY